MPIGNETLISKESMLSIQGISKIYRTNNSEIKALHNVTFELHRGEFIAIMGTSGSGKSTLLNIIGALDQPDEGIVEIKDVRDPNMFVEPFATTYRSENIGYIFQDFQLLKDFTVEENIAIPLILSNKYSQNQIRAEVSQMITRVGLDRWKSHRPVQLSGGQQQRVAIARALIHNPPILLADEPTGNLDYNSSLEIMDVLVETKGHYKQSVLLVTHDPVIATYADRVLFFHDGLMVDEYQCVNSERDRDLENVLRQFKQIVGRA